MQTRAVGLLAAGLAHDLNNMLGGIVAAAELVRDRLGGDPEGRRDLDAIIDQALKASRLIGQIRAFSRQEFLAPTTAPLADLALGLSPILAALAGPAIDLRCEALGKALVRIDPTALERVVVNLVINARDAIGPAGGCIRLSTGTAGPDAVPAAGRHFMPPGAYAWLAVDDDGPGIDPRIAPRIFEPYFTTRANGQGLGLATAYGLVKQSAGFLLHEPSPLGGARFSIWLPVAHGESLRQTARPAGAPGRIIVLAEDDLLLRLSLARALERKGYRVRQAGDGQAALARLAEEPPALLISDIRMDGLDGIALSRRVRAQHPELPILLISGFADEAARAAVPDIGAALLRKPFTMQQLGAEVARLI